MSIWSANLLTSNYPKCIVGFDLRSSPKVFEEISKASAFQSSGNLGGGKKFIATIDNQVWPEQINSRWAVYQHGLNLFDRPLEKVDGLEFPINSMPVAFDLPITLASTLVSTFGVVLLPIELVSENKDWEFIGYDIVDARTQCSGIYSFDWSETELADILNRLSLPLNKNGLVDDELLAINAAIAFDIVVKEHAPFAPCGVWIKNSATSHAGKSGSP